MGKRKREEREFIKTKKYRHPLFACKDILLLILYQCNAKDIESLYCTCTFLYKFINNNIRQIAINGLKKYNTYVIEPVQKSRLMTAWNCLERGENMTGYWCLMCSSQDITQIVKKEERYKVFPMQLILGHLQGSVKIANVHRLLPSNLTAGDVLG